MADKSEKKANSGTAIKQCKATNCISSYQDGKYGINQRVHNTCTNGFRCTVCGNVRQNSQ